MSGTPAVCKVLVVSRNVFHVASNLQSIVCNYIFLANQISCKSYVGSFFCMQSLAVSGFSKLEPAIWSSDIGLWLPCFDRCQLSIKLIFNTKH